MDQRKGAKGRLFNIFKVGTCKDAPSRWPVLQGGSQRPAALAPSVEGGCPCPVLAQLFPPAVRAETQASPPFMQLFAGGLSLGTRAEVLTPATPKLISSQVKGTPVLVPPSLGFGAPVCETEVSACPAAQLAGCETQGHVGTDTQERWSSRHRLRAPSSRKPPGDPPPPSQQLRAACSMYSSEGVFRQLPCVGTGSVVSLLGKLVALVTWAARVPYLASMSHHSFCSEGDGQEAGAGSCPSPVCFCPEIWLQEETPSQPG